MNQVFDTACRPDIPEKRTGTVRDSAAVKCHPMASTSPAATRCISSCRRFVRSSPCVQPVKPPFESRLQGFIISLMETIGFIGLGIMGKPMTRNLLKAGYEVRVFDIVAATVEGPQPVSPPPTSPRTPTSSITMRPMGPMSMPQSSADRRSGRREARLSRRRYELHQPHRGPESRGSLRAKGVDFLDAPVSGGEPKAIEGTWPLWSAANGVI